MLDDIDSDISTQLQVITSGSIGGICSKIYNTSDMSTSCMSTKKRSETVGSWIDPVISDIMSEGDCTVSKIYPRSQDMDITMAYRALFEGDQCSKVSQNVVGGVVRSSCLLIYDPRELWPRIFHIWVSKCTTRFYSTRKQYLGDWGRDPWWTAPRQAFQQCRCHSSL